MPVLPALLFLLQCYWLCSFCKIASSTTLYRDPWLSAYKTLVFAVAVRLSEGGHFGIYASASLLVGEPDGREEILGTVVWGCEVVRDFKLARCDIPFSAAAIDPCCRHRPLLFVRVESRVAYSYSL